MDHLSPCIIIPMHKSDKIKVHIESPFPRHRATPKRPRFLESPIETLSILPDGLTSALPVSIGFEITPTE